MRKIFIFLILLTLTTVAKAQRSADLGIWAGFSGYQGDMSELDRIASVGVAGAVFFRYNFNARNALRTTAQVGVINGIGEFDSSKMEFSKTISDFSLMYEFNFLRYLIGSTKRSMTTYLLIGGGVSLYSYYFDKEMLNSVGAYSTRRCK